MPPPSRSTTIRSPCSTAAASPTGAAIRGPAPREPPPHEPRRARRRGRPASRCRRPGRRPARGTCRAAWRAGRKGPAAQLAADRELSPTWPQRPARLAHRNVALQGRSRGQRTRAGQERGRKAPFSGAAAPAVASARAARARRRTDHRTSLHRGRGGSGPAYLGGVRAVLQHPARAALAGAVAIAFSGILYRLSEVSPRPARSSAAPARYRRCGSSSASRSAARAAPARPEALGWLAGAFFAADLLLWHHSIEAVGAGLATVLGNTQVVLVGLLAWVLLRRAAVGGLARRDPRRGRRDRADLRACSRTAPTATTRRSGRSTACSPAWRTRASCSRSGTARATGAGWPGRSSTPRSRRPCSCSRSGSSPATSTCSRTSRRRRGCSRSRSARRSFGWLLITVSLPRLPAVVTSVLLTLQPVASVVLAAIILGEDPSPLQLVGAGAILAGLLIASVGRRATRPARPGAGMKLRAPTLGRRAGDRRGDERAAPWLHGSSEVSEDEVRLWFEAPDVRPERTPWSRGRRRLDRRLRRRLRLRPRGPPDLARRLAAARACRRGRRRAPGRAGATCGAAARPRTAA